MITPRIVAEVRNGRIKHGNKVILDQIDFSIAESEFCYIIGKTGSGKSSLLKVLYGAKNLDKGVATVAGVKLNTLSTAALPEFRRNLGMVFQDYLLIHDWSVNQNLDYILKATDWSDHLKRKQRIREVLDAVDMSDKINEMVGNLSGGEKQRVAIARAILNKPQLIIADEPTGNLDPDTSDNILFLLRDLAISNNSAIIMATHDYRLLEKLPARVYRCKNVQLQELSQA